MSTWELSSNFRDFTCLHHTVLHQHYITFVQFNEMKKPLEYSFNNNAKTDILHGI